MGLASGLIHVQLFLAVQNSLFCWLILKMCVSYDVILMYYLNYEHWFVVQTVLPFTARCCYSRYLSITANELEVSPIGLLPR